MAVEQLIKLPEMSFIIMYGCISDSCEFLQAKTALDRMLAQSCVDASLLEPPVPWLCSVCVCV